MITSFPLVNWNVPLTIPLPGQAVFAGPREEQRWHANVFGNAQQHFAVLATSKQRRVETLEHMFATHHMQKSCRLHTVIS